jgi:hypothetical protein
MVRSDGQNGDIGADAGRPSTGFTRRTPPRALSRIQPSNESDAFTAGLTAATWEGAVLLFTKLNQ